jgi:hypothetical protein
MVKVSVYSGTGSIKQVEFVGAKWSELQQTLAQNGISYNSDRMIAVIGETELTLQSNDAIIPTTDFTLFLLPQKVKSGSDDEDSYDESYDESYDDSDDDDDNEIVPAVNPSGVPADVTSWTKEHALIAINLISTKTNEINTLGNQIRQYVTNMSVSPLDDKAKELMNKLFK